MFSISLVFTLKVLCKTVLTGTKSLGRSGRHFLHIEDLDIVDGTPLLDIKPYVPRFDERTDVRTGWLEENGDRL
ncbi:MAG: hypothetical protein GX322_08815, partial [Firmicutes bacterium]|nr:hypothetical protein [Bacillota bacterium]